MNLEEQQGQLLETREEWQQALASTEDSDEEKERLLERRDVLRENLDRLRQELGTIAITPTSYNSSFSL